MSGYREVILQLSDQMRGFAIDASCPKCKFPEMSLLIDAVPDIYLCRKCGHAQRTRPRS